MKRIAVSLCVVALALALPAAAQMAPKSITRVVVVKAKNGMHQQFEEGLKKYHQWEHQQNRPFTYYVWVVISGDRTGEYVLVSGGHDWKDFDEVLKSRPAGDSKELAADVGPYVESFATSYWQAHPDLTSIAPQAGQTPAQYLSVTTYSVKLGSGDDFEEAIKAADEAIKKTQWPALPSQWFSLINGGEGGVWVHATGHKDWASFQPPEPSFGKMLSGVFGKEGSNALFQKFVKSLISVRSEIFRYDPDLSYIPNSQ